MWIMRMFIGSIASILLKNRIVSSCEQDVDKL
jgi:hypothetical protein